MIPRPPRSTLLPDATLFRSRRSPGYAWVGSPRTPARLPIVSWNGTSVRHPPTARTAPTKEWRLSSRSEEHMSELQSRQYIVCRLLLHKKRNHRPPDILLNHA